MKKWIILGVSAVVIIALVLGGYLVLNHRGTTDIVIDNKLSTLQVSSPAFNNLEAIPVQYTGQGEDISPAFSFANLDVSTVTIAIIMDDLDIPWSANFTHWVIWNIPATATIPEAIPAGETVAELGGAVQGVGYGKHQYLGPNPPFGSHRYQFHIFALDTSLDLTSASGKAELLDAMEGHIIQYGTLTGWFPEVTD